MIKIIISKKELLIETGISYGQLYRWKREGLIPEHWFIKQSSFTGQETFFPKGKILKRINDIQALKDDYSLEQISKILAPEISEREFKIEDLYLIEELEGNLVPSLCNVLKKNTFSYIEVLFFVSICHFFKQNELSFDEKQKIVFGIDFISNQIKKLDIVINIIKFDNNYFVLSFGEGANFFVDKRFEKVFEQSLNDVSTNFKIKYKRKFNFKIDI